LGDRLYDSVGVTDAEWRGYGRKFIKNSSRSRKLSGAEVFKDTGTTDCWLTLGANRVKSTNYLLVVGVHIFPVRHFDMDFER
jgi:hypothetical protein